MTISTRRTVLLTAFVSVALALTVSGCGKKGAPMRPEGSDFPRQYPNPNPNPPPPNPQQ